MGWGHRSRAHRVPVDVGENRGELLARRQRAAVADRNRRVRLRRSAVGAQGRGGRVGASVRCTHVDGLFLDRLHELLALVQVVQVGEQLIGERLRGALAQRGARRPAGGMHTILLLMKLGLKHFILQAQRIAMWPLAALFAGSLGQIKLNQAGLVPAPPIASSQTPPQAKLTPAQNTTQTACSAHPPSLAPPVRPEAASAAHPPPSAASELNSRQVSVKGTHNSYHLTPDDTVLVPYLFYCQRPLNHQVCRASPWPQCRVAVAGADAAAAGGL